MKKQTQTTITDFSFFDHCPQGFYAISTDWKYIYVNRAGLKMAQKKKSDLVNKNPQELFSDAHSLEFGQAVRRVMQERKARKVEAFYPRYNKWYENVVFPIQDGVGIIAQDITTRKRLEENLLLTTAQFSALADNIPNLAWMADSKGKIYWYNSSWYKYTGKNERQMQKQGWKKVHDPRLLPLVVKKWTTAVKNGLPFEMEFPLKDSHGQFHDFLTQVTPVKDNHGNVLHWFGTNTDLTNQKKIEEAQLRLAAIVEFSDDAIISEDLRGYITSWNKGAERLFQYKAEEVLNKSVNVIVPPDLLEQEKEILSNLKKGKSTDHLQTVRISKDGTRINVSLSISTIKNPNGELIGGSKIIHDISDIKRNEENLKFLARASKILSSSLDYQKTLNNLTQLAVPHIADWCSVDMLNSSSQVELVALAHKDPKKVAWAKELRQRQPIDMNAPLGVPNVLRTGKSEIYPIITDAMLVAAAKNQKELQLARQIGFTSVIIVPILSQRKPIGAISFITTESRKRYVEADLTVAEEIASRASLAIENSRLYRSAQKELNERKKLEKQKDEFIGVASHELKTPVTSIKSYTQMLHYKFKKEGQLEAANLLAKLDTQIDKLTDLIGDLLDVTKIEAGKMAFNTTNFDFDDLVEEIVEEMQIITAKHKLIINGSSNQTINGDRERIGQVLINLISNAIKYSPNADKIVISNSREGKNVKLCVQDFGLGIPEEKKNQVFNRFFRISGPNQETFPGLGLGLYISSEIIKRSKGKIWVESREGEGSVFCFSLPLKNMVNN